MTVWTRQYVPPYVSITTFWNNQFGPVQVGTKQDLSKVSVGTRPTTYSTYHLVWRGHMKGTLMPEKKNHGQHHSSRCRSIHTHKSAPIDAPNTDLMKLPRNNKPPNILPVSDAPKPSPANPFPLLLCQKSAAYTWRRLTRHDSQYNVRGHQSTIPDSPSRRTGRAPTLSSLPYPLYTIWKPLQYPSCPGHGWTFSPPPS
jgi:hypothetical protein